MSRVRELRAAIATGACALCVDASILYGLTAFGRWHYLLAASVAFLAGSVVAWLLSVRFVFQYRRYRSAGREFAFFALIGALGLALNALVIATVVESFGQHYLVGKACAAAVTFGFNYSLRKTLLFSPAAFSAAREGSK
jgi:putative flippase GtrA